MMENLTDEMLAVIELRQKWEYFHENADHFFLIVMACIIFRIGAVAYWGFGFAFAYGSESNPFIGYRGFFFENVPSSSYSFFFFQFVFAATGPTIVAGALAERTRFVAYFVYSFFITGFIYPVVTHWAWASDGWLRRGVVADVNGQPESIVFQDFAGSAVVHCVGGTGALIGAALLGPRIGRYDENWKPLPLQGHNTPMVSLGGFILFFGFLAFNGGSQASISAEGDGEVVAQAIVNTIISGAFAALSAMIIRYIAFKGHYWSFLATVNGGLTGMVAICAGCNVVYPWGAAIIGAVAGAAYIGWSSLMVRVKLDDPVDAVAVHLGGSLWGVLAAPIFAAEEGIVFTFSLLAWLRFAWNLLGVMTIFLWTAALSFIMFGLLKYYGFLRVDPEVERKGLDLLTHGEPAYPDPDYYNYCFTEKPEIISTIELPRPSESRRRTNDGQDNPIFRDSRPKIVRYFPPEQTEEIPL